MAMVVPGLIPSFWTSGFPEYPAIFAALAACRLLPPVAALVHHPPDPAGRVVGDVQGAVGATATPTGRCCGPAPSWCQKPSANVSYVPTGLPSLNGTNTTR